MNFTVAIPTYNSSRYIRSTLESVLAQTLAPFEILIVDDGSTDDTISILGSFSDKVRLLRQQNQGVATARNVLVSEARSELIAFLDHDDLWHPCYLETQKKQFLRFSEAIAAFTGHIDFSDDKLQWNDIIEPATELITPLEFLKLYNRNTAQFASMSYCCVRKEVLRNIGPNPFQVSGVDDSYLCTLFPLHGPVAYSPAKLAAYRFTPGAQSSNRLKSTSKWVHVFELLFPRYKVQPDRCKFKAFKEAFAAKRRFYAKLLIGMGDVAHGREQFLKAAALSTSPACFLKSFLWWTATFLPNRFGPIWPTQERPELF